MRLFDAHCHLDLPELDGAREAMLVRARTVGVERILVPGYHPEQWEGLRAFRERHAGVGVAVGIHPWELDTLSPESTREALASLPEVAMRVGAVAIGEFGLDRRHTRDPDALARQVEVFRAHVAAARALGLPMVLHVVEAHGHVLELLEAERPLPAGMLHSYSGSAELVARFVALGLHVSFSGVVTRTAAKKVRAAAVACPLDRLLVETDAPSLAAEGVSKPSEPAHVRLVVDALGSLRGESAEAVAERTFANAERLFDPRGFC